MRLPCKLSLLCFITAIATFYSPAHPIGVNWGSIVSQPLPPSVVVQMLQANNITKVKLFDASPTVLQALSGTNIEVMVGIPNDFLLSFSTSSAATDAWIHDNLTRYMIKGGVNIRYVAVGNEPFLTSYAGQFQKSTFPALNNIYQSIVKAGFGGQVKVTVPCNADVLQNTLPSKGAFRPDIKDAMTQIASLLSQIDSVLLVNIYPFLDLVLQSNFPEDYAFFDGTTHSVQDGQITYTNALDASYDMLVSALANVGFPNLPVVIGEIGWPSDGAFHANMSNAQRFNQGLLRHITSKQGTPLRPGAIEAYLFSLVDENEKSLKPGNFERHWGIFTFDGQAKYPLDLAGQGRNINLDNAENVPYLASRWCVAIPTSNISKLSETMSFACSSADCTALGYGGSCNDIGFQGNVSYAFNSYYQLNKQDESSCFFGGLGLITFVDPSIGNCRFLVGVSDSSAAISFRCLKNHPMVFAFIFTLLIILL